MPWPTFSHMRDGDIEASTEYLSAIPCIDNTTSTPPAGAPDELLNDCGSGGSGSSDGKGNDNQETHRSRRPH